MKKILFLLFTMIILCSCKPENIIDEPDNGKLDPNATIVLRPADGIQLRSTVSDMTALEIVKQAVNIKWRSHWFSTGDESIYKNDELVYARTFIEAHRDLQTPALKMWGTDIIAQGGYFVKDFIYGYDVVITDTNNDTIAYVPDIVLEKARPLIETAFADSNYNEVYRIFNEAFSFKPID